MSIQRRSPIMNEVVVAAWRNNEGDVCGLGCATPFNEQDPNLIFTVLLDEEGVRIFARIGLSVMVMGGGHRKPRGFDFLVPMLSTAAGQPSFAFSTIDISEIQHNSIRAAVSNARLSSSGRLIRVDLGLNHRGVVVTPWKEEARFSTCSDTSLDLLSSLFCLSDSKAFTLYMGLSDYADVGLNRLKSLLLSKQLQEWPPEETGLYGGRKVMAVNRQQVESGRKYRSRGRRNGGTSSKTITEPPPPYDHPEVLVPRSPTDMACRISSPSDSLLAEDSCVPEINIALEKAATKPAEAPLRTPGKRKRTDSVQETSKQNFSQRPKDWLTLCEDDCVPSPPPATGKCQRDPSSTVASNAKWTAKNELARDLGLLMQVALPTLPPREFAQPHLQPYLDDFKTAIRVVNAHAFERAYGRFVALLLFDSIIPELVSDKGGNTTSADAAKMTDRNTHDGVREEESEAWESVSPLAREYLNDIFTVVTWVHSGNGYAVPAMWKSFCELGRAAREASDQGLSLQEASKGEYGEVKARILTLAIVGV